MKENLHSNEKKIYVKIHYISFLDHFKASKKEKKIQYKAASLVL